MPTIHLLIKGKVQGVFFRVSAKQTADALGLKGWVKNTTDHNVEAMVTGSDEKLKEFIAWCRKGPEKAVVEDVVVSEKQETPYLAFEIIRRR